MGKAGRSGRRGRDEEPPRLDAGREGRDGRIGRLGTWAQGMRETAADEARKRSRGGTRQGGGAVLRLSSFSNRAVLLRGGPGSDRSVRSPLPRPAEACKGSSQRFGHAGHGTRPRATPAASARREGNPAAHPTRPVPSGAAVGERPLPPHLGDGARAHVASLAPQAPAVPDEPPPPPEPALAHPGNTAPAPCLSVKRSSTTRSLRRSSPPPPLHGGTAVCLCAPPLRRREGQ